MIIDTISAFDSAFKFLIANTDIVAKTQPALRRYFFFDPMDLKWRNLTKSIAQVLFHQYIPKCSAEDIDFLTFNHRFDLMDVAALLLEFVREESPSREFFNYHIFKYAAYKIQHPDEKLLTFNPTSGNIEK